MYPCFLFGIFCMRNMHIIISKAKLISIISGVIFLTLSFLASNCQDFWSRDLGLKQLLISGDLSLIDDFPFLLSIILKRYEQILLGCLGALFFLSLFTLIFNKKPSLRISQLALFGQYTLGIYVIQTIIVETVMPHILSFSQEYKSIFNILIAPSISIIVVYISLSINILINKKKGILSLLLFGEKFNKYKN